MLAYRVPHSPEFERRAAVREFQALAARLRRLSVRAARAIQELKRTGAHFSEGASSIAHFAERNGMSGQEARELEALGDAIEREPAIVSDVHRGLIPVASAAILGRVATEPGLVRPGDEWTAWARTKSTRELRRLYFERRDEARAGEDVVPLTAFVTVPVRENIARARVLASRKMHWALTTGQTLGILVDDWLEKHDPLRAIPGTRRLSSTEEIPDSRYVPAEADREVRARSDDRCIVPLCDQDIWVHRSHRKPHRHGGSREAANLDLLCDYHHFLYEAGSLLITGPPEAPMFTDREGKGMNERTACDGQVPRPHANAAELASPRPGASVASCGTALPAAAPGSGPPPPQTCATFGRQPSAATRPPRLARPRQGASARMRRRSRGGSGSAVG